MQGADFQRFLTLMDVDDTCIFWENINNRDAHPKIKNPQYLLPIKGFMSWHQNQIVGLLTYRGPKDEHEPYTVQMYTETLSDFGIDIPEEQVIFGGDEHSRIKEEEFQSSQLAVNTLSAQFKSLNLLDMGESYSQEAQRLNESFLRFTQIKFEGKNFHILKHLKECEHGDSFRFKRGSFPKVDIVVPKTSLNVVMVDDLPVIAKATSKLGSQFFGVTASAGGKAPPENADDAKIREYYGVGYMHELAKIIGLADYCESLLHSPEKHADDHPMAQVNALLYLWQTSTDPSLSTRIKEIETRLSNLQCDQIAKMLEYIIAHKITHQYAEYTSVDPLLAIFKPRANVGFLEHVTQQISVIENKIRSLMPPPVIEQPTAPLERSKGSLKLFSRNKGSGKSTTPVPLEELSPKVVNTKIFFEEKKRALIARVEELMKSEHVRLAKKKYLAITKQSNDVQQAIPRSPSLNLNLNSMAVPTSKYEVTSKSTGNSRSPSGSDSGANSGANSGAASPPLMFRKRSISFNEKSGDPMLAAMVVPPEQPSQMRTVKSAGSFEDIFSVSVPQPPKDVGKKKGFGYKK